MATVGWTRVSDFLVTFALLTFFAAAIFDESGVLAVLFFVVLFFVVLFFVALFFVALRAELICSLTFSHDKGQRLAPGSSFVPQSHLSGQCSLQR